SVASVIFGSPLRSSGQILRPGVVLPFFGKAPLGIATELPSTGVELPHASSSSKSWSISTSGGFHLAFPPLISLARSALIASTTSSSAFRLWPLTSASQYGSAATSPPACGEKPSALTRGLTQTIR